MRPLRLAALGFVVAPLVGCVRAGGFQDGGTGRAYLVEARHYVVTSSTVVWSCDATTGAPQCWRVVETDGR